MHARALTHIHRGTQIQMHTHTHACTLTHTHRGTHIGMDDKIDKTAYTRGLDEKKKMSAYSIILDIKE